MTQMCLRTGLFVLVNLVAGALWLLLDGRTERFERWETDANLAVMPRDADLDWVFAGSSHGWALSACAESAAVVKDVFGPSTLNLSKKGCGPLPALSYLETFYARGNSADTLVYIVDPWAVAYRRWNEDAPFLHDEPFEPRFWATAAMNGTSLRQIAAGLRVKFTGRERPDAERMEWCSRTLDAVDQESAAQRKDFLYPGVFDASNMATYGAVLEEIVALAQAQQTRVLFVIPPTLLGPLPGEHELRELLKGLEADMGVMWHDASDAFSEPGLFRDHDHLNAVGVRVLCEEVIAPMVLDSAA